MKHKEVFFGLALISVVSILVITMVESNSRAEDTKKLLYLVKQNTIDQLKEARRRQSIGFVTPVSDTVPRDTVPWHHVIGQFDQFGSGYNPIGTATAQASDNDTTYILEAKPANSRNTKFWLRIRSPQNISTTYKDIYLAGMRDRLYTDNTLDVPELPNDTPLVISITAAWYLYG